MALFIFPLLPCLIPLVQLRFLLQLMDQFLQRPYRSYIGAHWRTFSSGLLALLFTNTLDAFAPLLVGRALDLLIANRPFAEVRNAVFILIGVTAALALFRFLWRFFWGRFHHTVAEDLRNRLFAKFTELGPAFFAKNPSGELMSLINNDVNAFRMAIGPGILVFFDSLFILAVIPALMWSISPDWTWKCLCLLPLVPFVIRFILKRTNLAYQNQQLRFGEMAGSAQEIVSGIRVIKSYAQEDNQTILFNRHSRNFSEACNRVARTDAMFGPALEIATAFGGVILLLVGSPQVMAGTVTIGSFFAFYQYIQKMVWPMEGLGVAFSHFQLGRAAFKRIRDLISTPIDTPDTGQAEVKDIQTLEVKNLDFSYPGENRPILKDISFSLKKGEILGIVGTTGSGKTSLVEAICRLYPTRPESIFINDIPIEKINKTSLRGAIAAVPQDTFVFSRQVGENILFGKTEESPQELNEIASLVQLHDEIISWPEGYKTSIGERGVNLSGGQRQRLTLARALIRSAPLVILDDCLSAVDAKTSASIMGNLRQRLRQGSRCAAIVISHRLDNIAWADQIMVLNHGKIEAHGKHEDLLRTSPTYQHLYELQVSGASS